MVQRLIATPPHFNKRTIVAPPLSDSILENGSTVQITVDDIRVFVEKPKALKPQFPWEQLAKNLLIPSRLPQVKTARVTCPCNVEKLLRAVGSAVTDDRLARGLETKGEIFTSETCYRVVSTVNRVLLHLAQLEEGIVESPSVHEIVENSLYEEKERLAAKGYLLYRTQKHRRRQVVQGLHVMRRHGSKVPWNPDRIREAITKAFLAQWIQKGEEPTEAQLHVIGENAEKVAHQVIYEITGRSRNVIHIEEIQDGVERSLAALGFVETSKRYAAYRLERMRIRKQKAMEESLPLLSQWVTPNLLARIDFSSTGLHLPLNREQIARRIVASMSDGLTPQEVAQSAVLNTRMLIELDPEFRFFAGRLLLTYIYEEALEWRVEDGIGRLRAAHERAFEIYLKQGIELGLLDSALQQYDIARIAKHIDPMADLNFDYLGIHTLYDRYLLHERIAHPDPTAIILDKWRKKRIEVPQFMWMRVAMGLALGEKDREESAFSFYTLYATKRFCSSTPTLFNAGTCRPQLSSCYGLTSGDDIGSIASDEEGAPFPTGIFGTFTNCALLSKYAGGLGVDFTYVRGTGSYIRGTNGESLGITPFLKILNDTALAVNQGGKRRGVVCAYLETWHNDIEEFLELRKNTGDDRRRTHDLHIANWIPDLFILRAIRGQDWTLFRSNEVPGLHDSYGSAFQERYEEFERRAQRGEIYGRTIRASALWKKMLSALFETGHPWMTFKDPCNIRSPQDHVGVIHNSNLCTEITLNNSDEEHFVCNLGSINLPAFVDEEGNWNRKELAKSIQIAVRMLDNVIDINFYPTLPARKANMRHRPIGLGIMGWQDVLHKLNIPFESEEMVALSDQIMEFIAWHAYDASANLAKEKGTYSTFKGSKWSRGLMPLDTIALLETERGVDVDVNRNASLNWRTLREKIRKNGMRNSNVLAIAPTATISNIFGSSPCIEPDYRHIFSKSNLSGEFIWVTPALVKALKRNNLWNDRLREEIKYAKGELENIETIPQKLRNQFKTAFKIDQKWLLRAAAVRQKWIDQSQSINLFLDRPDEKLLSLLFLTAWKMGLKTTYYLKNKSASDIEDASLDIKRKSQEINLKACSVDTPDCEACQ